MTLRRIDGDYVKSPCGSPSVTITRPDNTTAYTASDVVGTSPATNIEFENVLPTAGEHYYITGSRLVYNANAVPASMSTFTLHLFNAAPTAIADNSAWSLASADKDKYLGSITITLPIDLGDVLVSHDDSINIKRKLATDSTSIYGQLVTDGAFTPAAEAVIDISLEVIAA
jgi:hypothetical protein